MTLSYAGPEVRKIYLSAILDLCDRRIVSFAIGDHNDNRLVFATFDAVLAAAPLFDFIFSS